MNRRIALCYVRKSVVKTGAPDPASPEIQRRKLLAWCQSEDLEPEWHEDTTGHNSGMKTDRPAWRAAIGRLSDPDVAYLLVTDYDRATRNVKDLLTVVDECERYGVKFKALASPYDVSTGQGRTFATIISAVNEGYARDVSEWRAASIDNLRRDRGRHVGPPPFGTVRVRQGGDLVLVGDMRQQPNGTDLECLAELYRLYGKEHLSYYATARRLNDTGWRLRGKGGLLKEWNDTDVRRLVMHHWIYAGHVVVGRSDRLVDEVLPGSHAPILPPDLTQPVGIRATVFKRLTPAIHRHYSAPLSMPAERKGCWVFPGQIVGASEWLAEIWSKRAVLRPMSKLIVWGTKDIAFRENELKTWSREFPEAQILRQRGVGHYVQEELGPGLGDIVARFLDTHPLK